MFSFSLGEGVELRPLEPWQAEEFAAHIDRVREHIAPWLPFERDITDTESARRFLQGFADSQAKDGPRLYGVHSDGELVGGGFYRLFEPAEGSCELGAWVDPATQGRGVAFRVLVALIDWAVETRGISRVQALIEPENERSLAMVKRLGMTYEGTMRSVFPTGGARMDVQVHSVLSDEWKARPRP
ncbi:GNAT family N-acetyltransferase [Streptomyces hesseae]|uniref:GNAT family protein n=1 Tax=Streptomyces hesseae TaxID=3075519 RepID=A0ABU2SY92_9ACTN|nr:GNAT family protein [Streptomyces sp. DSM 40473]MDT0453972.1 GNAT family protein [Streptomyces sp. DSM 40473]